MTEEIKNFLAFYQKAEKLKSTTRHSWTADANRQESTAEHSWMLGLLAMVLVEKLETPVDLLKVLKMTVIHDLAEAVTGDIPASEVSDRQKNKYESEKKAIAHIVEGLPKRSVDEIISLWEEHEEKKTPEAQFAHALDKIEAVMQHNLSDIALWDQGDFNIHPYYKNQFFDYDPFLRVMKDFVDVQSMEKILTAKQEHRIDKKHLEKYKSNK